MMIKKNKYHQVWKEIFKIVDNENGEYCIKLKKIMKKIMKKLYYPIVIYLPTK